MTVWIGLTCLVSMGIFPFSYAFSEMNIETTPIFAKYSPYDAEMTQGGKFLFTTHCYERDILGVTRINLETLSAQTCFHKHTRAHYLNVIDQKNRLYIVAFHQETNWSSVEGGSVLVYSIDPFKFLEEQPCDLVFPIKLEDYSTSQWLLLEKSDHMSLVESLDDVCGDLIYRLSLVEAKPQIRTLGSLIPPCIEIMVQRPNQRQEVWLIGEFGPVMYLVNPDQGKVLRAVRKGLHAWDGKIDKKTGRLFISRSWCRNIDIRKADTGRRTGSIKLPGVPRPLAIWEEKQVLFAGMYFGGRVAVIDIAKQKVKGYVKAGWKLRKLIIDRHRNDLIIVSKDQIERIPLKRIPLDE